MERANFHEKKIIRIFIHIFLTLTYLYLLYKRIIMAQGVKLIPIYEGKIEILRTII